MAAEDAVMVGDATLVAVAEVATMDAAVTAAEVAATAAVAAVASASFSEAAAGVEAAAEVIGAGSTVCGLGALIRMAISAQVGELPSHTRANIGDLRGVG
jgi:hypothetical protein